MLSPMLATGIPQFLNSLSLKVTVHVAGQNLGSGARRTDQQVVVDDGVGQFMGQHPIMQIPNINIYGVITISVPCANATGSFVDLFKSIMQLTPVMVNIDGYLVHSFSHVQYLLHPFKQNIHFCGNFVHEMIRARR